MNTQLIEKIVNNIIYSNRTTTENMTYLYETILGKYQPELKIKIDATLTLIDKKFGDNDGMLGTGDFIKIKRGMEQSKVFTASFCYVMSYNIKQIYESMKNVHFTDDELANFIFAVMVYIILLLLVKENNEKYIKDNKDEIIIMLNNLYAGYYVYVSSAHFVAYIREETKTLMGKLNSCCRKNKPNVINNTLEEQKHINIIKNTTDII